MLDRIRRALVGLTVQANRRTLDRDVRRLAAGAARAGEALPERIEEIAAVAEAHAREAASWVPHAVLTAGGGGRFDACDLRHWLALAERAGIPAVPAREVLVLDEDEVSSVAGTVELRDGPVRRRLAALATSVLGEADPPGAVVRPDPGLRERTLEAAAAAMDDVPEGWMVRHARCGPSVLKTLAGAGVAGPEAPEVRFGPDLEVGPGWVRLGNRRQVDVSDARTLKVAIGQGPDGPQAWLARPWARASRWTLCEDPHRQGTAFRGKGFWPAEWRAYVEGGRVTGVSYYYAWAGETSPEAASMALAVREAAQRLVDTALAQGAVPVLADVELARRGKAAVHVETRFPPGSFGCTLDFVETEDGLLLLEGGPPLTPIGGAHPTGFVCSPDLLVTGLAEGVVLALPPGVVMADPKTWAGHDLSGCLLTWEQAEDLARGHAPGPSPR